MTINGSPTLTSGRGGLPRYGSDRRVDTRIPIEMFMNEYVREEPCRALAVNLSESGLYLQKLVEPVTRHARIVALEFELPGTGETIWARGETRSTTIDEDFQMTGVRFLAMARKHERLVRDYVFDKQKERMDSVWLRLRLARLASPVT